MSEEDSDIVVVADTSSKAHGIKKAMVWTDEHDLLLTREVIGAEVFSTKKGTVQRSAKWGQVASLLSVVSRPQFKEDKRSVRDRYHLLAERLRVKLKKEAKESGISPNMTETEQALELFIELEEASDKLQQETSDKIKQKATSHRKDAEEVRRKAMEKLAASQKRKSGDDGGARKKLLSGSDTIAFLKERNEQQMSLARDKLELKSMELQSDAKRHDDLIRFMQHQQQLQIQNFQVFMTQHQEQMNVQQQQHMQLNVKLLDRVGK